MSLMNIATNIKENSSDGSIFDGKLTRLGFYQFRFNSTVDLQTGTLQNMDVNKIAFWSIFQNFHSSFFSEDIQMPAFKQSAKQNQPLDTKRTLNVHKTFRRSPGRLLNFLSIFGLPPVPMGYFLKVLNCCELFHWAFLPIRPYTLIRYSFGKKLFPEASLGPPQTSKMESFQPLTIVAKLSSLDVWGCWMHLQFQIFFKLFFVKDSTISATPNIFELLENCIEKRPVPFILREPRKKGLRCFSRRH